MCSLEVSFSFFLDLNALSVQFKHGEGSLERK
jgi:hypothetical protein